jgi:hypothetical protein
VFSFIWLTMGAAHCGFSSRPAHQFLRSQPIMRKVIDIVEMQPPFARFRDTDESKWDQYWKEDPFHMFARVMEEDVGNVYVPVA